MFFSSSMRSTIRSMHKCKFLETVTRGVLSFQLLKVKWEIARNDERMFRKNFQILNNGSINCPSECIIELLHIF